MKAFIILLMSWRSEPNMPLYSMEGHNATVKENFKIKDANEEIPSREYKYIWKNIILHFYLHVSAVIGIYLMFTSANWRTSIQAFVLYQIGGMGITAGVHRLWSHNAYQAKWPLRTFLALCNTLAFQESIIDWARDHRVHHKYSETDADPHNAKRGFFFCHVGWLLCRRHPEVISKGKEIDISDLYDDPILTFQKKHYVTLVVTICFIIPTVIPMYFWNETFFNAYSINLFRYALTLNATWMVNSVAHFYGNRPYDKFINPTENLVVALLAMGEGWHNFHHTFPWDYKTSELGSYGTNITTAFIDLMARIGLANNLKSVSPDLIQKKVGCAGDGTHEVWGWGDKDQPKEERDRAIITHKQDKTC